MKKFKLLGFIAILLISMISISACGNKTSTTDDESTEYYVTLAHEVITMFNEQNTDEIQKISTEDVKVALTDEVLNGVYTQLQSYGKFKEFLDSATDVINKDSKKYYTVIQKVKYEEQDIVFTVNFDEEGKLVGIFFK